MLLAEPPVPSRFQVRSQLGRGSAASVWEAWDQELRCLVALKVYHKVGGTRHGEQRVQREMELVEDLRHPNIVRYVARGEEPVPWLALELHPGTLKQRVKADGPLEADTLVAYVVDLLHALVLIHSRGVVHRDVKPSNVLLSMDGRAVLADLGVARVAESRLTGEGATLGTFLYMAPVQRGQAEAVDGRADLFGLGATVWYAALGRAPPDLSLIDLRPDLLEKLPPTLRPVVWKACSQDAPDRWSSAKEALACLEERSLLRPFWARLPFCDSTRQPRSARPVTDA